MDTISPTGSQMAMVISNNFMSTASARIIFIFLCSGIFIACNSCCSYDFDLNDKALMSEIARKKVLLADNIDEQSRQMIKANAPKIAYYRLAGDYAQYSFSWQISSNRILWVGGQGNIKTLDGATIIIKDK